jgi:hypothetical protein
MAEKWVAEAKTLLANAGIKASIDKIQKRILTAIHKGQYTYDTQDVVNQASKEWALLKKGNPVHNLKYAKSLVVNIKKLLKQADKKLTKLENERKRIITIKRLKRYSY